ncbi:hypothetical protein R6Q59_005796 [Mikania micrantha]
MHDLVRAFVLNKVSDVKQASITNYHDDNNSYQQPCERLLLKCTNMTKFPVDFTNYPNLSMLMLMDGDGLLKFPQDIYKRMEKLEVVSYENMIIPSSLLTFQHSITKLRTLSLRACGFINDDISLIGSLSNLETLSFVDCEIRRLPSVIGKLKKLKLLDLTGCVDLRIDDCVFENLKGLEELYMNAYFSSIRFTKANCEELEKLSHGLFALEVELFENKVKPKNMSFKNLERFKISIGCKLENLTDGQSNALTNTIQLVGDCNELLQCKINEIFNKTDGLQLQVNEMNHLGDILTHLHDPFSNLTVLHVSNCEDLTCLFTVDVASGLKKLERLTISDCPIMKTLVTVENGIAGVVRLQKLNFMSLTALPKMVSFWENVIELPEMVELKLDDLPNFTSIYPHGHDTSEMRPLLNKKVVIPRLEKLDISSMENLKHIWSYETVDENVNVSILRNIRVSNCKNLNNLFPLNPLPLLSRLEELAVDSCRSIEVLFNMEFESHNNHNDSRLRSIEVHNLGSLKELWRMINVGHVINNSDVRIKCFNNVESIKMFNCGMFTNIFTPATCNFDLEALTEIITKHIGGEEDQINAGISRGGEKSEMDEDIINPNYHVCTYTSRACHQLKKLELQYDKIVKEVLFEMDSHQLLPYSLESLELVSLFEMSHVWKCNDWNKFLIPHQHQPATLELQLPFQNLTNISLDYCRNLKYLFSPLMVKYLSNLRRVCIKECAIEEIISSRDDDVAANKENDASTRSSHQISTTSLLFPQLNILELKSLPCLRSFEDAILDQSQSGIACWSLCQYPRNIAISNCDAMSILIPWYAVGQMKRLEELKIWNCKTITKVFDEGSESGTTLTSPRVLLKSTNHVVHVPQLFNLQHVTIYECNLLSHVFTFSTLESLNQLKLLSVTNCNGIQEIVKQETNETTSSKDDHLVVLRRLKTLTLEHLPSFKGFFLGRNKFQWPLLDTLIINGCPQLMMLTCGESKTPKLNGIYTGYGKYSLDCGLMNFHGPINEHETTFPASSSSDVTVSKGMLCSFHNLIEIKIIFRYIETLIPSNVLLQLQKLEKIHLEICYKLKEVFEVVALEESDFNESQTTVVQIPNLKQVKLDSAYDLKYLWNSNGSMVLEFPNLTSVSIEYCESLEHVFTCSMIGSLVQLQDLRITSCRKIEVIVKEQEESEAKMMVLPCLKSLKLHKLGSFKGFCLGKENFSLPLLNSLDINGCPEIMVFTNGSLSTPELKVINTSFGMYYVKPNLNSFIKTKQEEGYEF